MRISDGSSDVCSSDLTQFDIAVPLATLEGCRDRAIKHGQIAGDVEVGKAIDELCTGLDRSKDMLPVDAERVGLGFRRFWGAASGNVVFSIGEADTEGAIVRITQVKAERSAIAVCTNLLCARIRVAIACEATNRIEPHTVAAHGCRGP